VKKDHPKKKKIHIERTGFVVMKTQNLNAVDRVDVVHAVENDFAHLL
jgi:hypothetical protein